MGIMENEMETAPHWGDIWFAFGGLGFGVSRYLSVGIEDVHFLELRFRMLGSLQLRGVESRF